MVLPEGLDFSAARDNLVVSPEWARSGRADLSQRLWEQIEAAHRRTGIDLVLSYCYSADVDPELIERVTQKGIPWVNFYCDSLKHFSLVEEIARVATLSWFPEQQAENFYRQIGARAWCAPYAVHHLVGETAASQPDAPYDVVFLGMPRDNRATILGILVKAGFRVAIGGPGWLKQRGNGHGGHASERATSGNRAMGRLGRAAAGVVREGWSSQSARLWHGTARRAAVGAIPSDQMLTFLRAGKVALGLNDTIISGRPISYLKFRDIEFPGLGSCYLTQANADVTRAFDVGREIEIFDSWPQLVWKLRRLLRDVDRRAAMSHAAAAAVRDRHTWRVRLRELLGELRS